MAVFRRAADRSKRIMAINGQCGFSGGRLLRIRFLALFYGALMAAPMPPSSSHSRGGGAGRRLRWSAAGRRPGAVRQGLEDASDVVIFMRRFWRNASRRQASGIE